MKRKEIDTELSVEDKFVRARLQMLQAYPFMGKFAIKLGVEVDTGIPTAGTNGLVVKYNPEFMGGLQMGEFNFVYMHEILHVLLQHMLRRGNRDSLLWNYACDYEVHNILIPLLHNDVKAARMYLSRPSDILYSEAYNNMNCYEIYEQLVTEKEEADGNLLGSHAEWGMLSKAEKEGILQEVTNYGGGRSVGTGSTRLDILLDELYVSKKNWREELIDFIEPSQDDYTFMQPDNRYLEGDFVIPALGDGEKIERLVVCIDTSGSIAETQMRAFLGEVRAMQESVGALEGLVCFFNTQVYNTQILREVRDIDLGVIQSGGTDIVRVFQELETMNDTEAIKGVILLTDGISRLPKKSGGDYDVLWVIGGNKGFKAPFGRQTTIES